MVVFMPVYGADGDHCDNSRRYSSCGDCSSWRYNCGCYKEVCLTSMLLDTMVVIVAVEVAMVMDATVVSVVVVVDVEAGIVGVMA